MTPHNRVLALLGGAALLASLTVAGVLVQTNADGNALQLDEASALRLEDLGNRLVAAVHEQRVALDEYLLSGDSVPLANYRAAVTDEDLTATSIDSSIAGAPSLALARVSDALTGVDTENDAWRSGIAEPAIAAVSSHDSAAIQAATSAAIHEAPRATTDTLVAQIAIADAALADRAERLDEFRLQATAVGVAVELLAAVLSLWFVRRYGGTVSRDARRRARAGTERVAIIASLRTLRTEATPEATAAVIAAALQRLPGVAVSGVLDAAGGGLLGLAVIGPPNFPIHTGQAMPADRARYLLERSSEGPWAERWTKPSVPTPYEVAMTALGIKGQAYAPVRANGEIVALIALATTDEEHARHLVEDLPAVGEFASVAEAILAPALVARRDRAAEQGRIAALIEAEAFRPVFQPIIHLVTGVVVGFEALTRFKDKSQTDAVFAAATACGMGVQLEVATLKAALAAAVRLPVGAWLSLNVSPALLAERTALSGILSGYGRDVVLEVTEHEAIDAYAPLRAAVLALGPGVQLAVDDAGAGVANFNHLVGLRPNFLKVDASLVQGVDVDASRSAVVVGLIHFAAAANCQVIAEGIETEAERRTLVDLGVRLGQGYLLAKPAPISTWRVQGWLEHSSRLTAPSRWQYPEKLRVSATH